MDRPHPDPAQDPLAARLAALRTEYASTGLDEDAVGDDPLPTLRAWLADAVASGMHEPNAMALATATPDGVPSVRIVLLKGFDERGLVLYTGYGSRKGAELAANPRAAATLLWHPLQRQVRVEGRVERVSARESDDYFASRPHGSQVGAVASQQSRPVADRTSLEAQARAVAAEVGDGPVARPADWGGFRVALDVVELWQGRADRLHDRLRFTRDGDGWTRERLQP